MIRTLQALPKLAFDGQEDERLFAQESFALWLRHSIISGVLALFFNNAFLLLDYLISPAVFEVGLHIRLYWCTSICLLVPMLAFLTLKGIVRPSPIVQEIAVVTGTSLAGLSILLVAYLSPLRGTTWSVVYHVGLVPVMAFGTVMARLRCRSASVLIAIMLVMHWAALAISPAVPEAPIYSVMLSVFVPACFILLFSYQFESAERLRFAHRQRAGRLRTQLLAKRSELEHVSYRDSLTDLLNRRGFNHHMQGLAPPGESLRDDRQPYALFLLDIDHFKLYNDNYGHLGGDECLRQVAKVLAGVAARQDAVLARWGGEEFVIALAHDNAVAADKLARGLCEAVRSAELPHAYSKTDRFVTVSVGFALSSQFKSGVPWHEVLGKADEALYNAKSSGRNRAVAA